jgi:hypothetical protein
MFGERIGEGRGKMREDGGLVLTYIFEFDDQSRAYIKSLELNCFAGHIV